MQGVVFFSGPQQYMWYVVVLRKTCNEGDRTFYSAINCENFEKVFIQPKGGNRREKEFWLKVPVMAGE